MRALRGRCLPTHSTDRARCSGQAQDLTRLDLVRVRKLILVEFPDFARPRLGGDRSLEVQLLAMYAAATTATGSGEQRRPRGFGSLSYVCARSVLWKLKTLSELARHEELG